MPIRRPTALKILDGVGPSKMNTDEATPLSEKPKMPGWFTIPQQQLWRSITRQLAGMRMLTAADSVSLINLVLTAELSQRIAMQINEMELTTSTEKLDHLNPLLLALDRAVMRTTTICREFGLTPSSRASLRMSAVGTDSEGAVDSPDSFFRSA